MDVRLGEEPGDPKFCITDILPHLALEQYTRKINELIKGEELNIVIGSRPFKDDKANEKVKLNILNLLYEKYGIVERDLLSAEPRRPCVRLSGLAGHSQRQRAAGVHLHYRADG